MPCKQFLLSFIYHNAMSWQIRLWSITIGQIIPTTTKNYGSRPLIRCSRCPHDDSPLHLRPGKMLDSGWLSGIPSSTRPVSYTHLDVYKRQSFTIMQCPGKLLSIYYSLLLYNTLFFSSPLLLKCLIFYIYSGIFFFLLW